jgi:hypothetical protein
VLCTIKTGLRPLMPAVKVFVLLGRFGSGRIIEIPKLIVFAFESKYKIIIPTRTPKQKTANLSNFIHLPKKSPILFF